MSGFVATQLCAGGPTSGKTLAHYTNLPLPWTPSQFTTPRLVSHARIQYPEYDFETTIDLILSACSLFRNVLLGTIH
ncbi:hypothetical protein BDM02DRAFT_3119313 [Thelephora ganbajun]|uniref:Uncharacterized protein n=1 Tax=Thelephora ganbajun TaxID=370292 RepID=A0ACB6Z8S2_THEGA|nr:hypothetical protein BDM02DRAFT_3119313 [Thelephora ganbajun]